MEIVNIPAGKTKGEIVALKKSIDQNIMGSADLSYRPDLWRISSADP